MEIRNEQDALKVFESLVRKVLPGILQQGQQNLKVGTVIWVAPGTTPRRASVQLQGSTEVFNQIPLGKGITNVIVGDTAIVFSVDPKLKLQNFIIGVI